MTGIIEVLEKLAALLHHHKLLLAWSGSVTAWLFCVSQVTQCSFLGNGGTNRIGLFSREYSDQKGEFLGCIRYTRKEVDTMDSMMRAGRAFMVVTLLYMSLVVAGSSYCILMAPRRCNKIWRANKYLLAAAALSQTLTLLAAGSRVCGYERDEPCELVGVGILAIFNIFVLIILCTTFGSLDLPLFQWLQLIESEAHVNRSQGRNRNFILRYSGQNPARFRVFLTGLVLIVMVMSAVALSRCTFVVVEAAGYGPTNIASGLGLYTQAIQVQGSFVGCVAYPTSISFDRPFKAARSFATLSVVLTLGAFLSFSVALVREDAQRMLWMLLRVLLPLSGFFLVLGTVALRSDNCGVQGATNCRLGSAGVLAMFLVVLLIFLSVVVWIQPISRSAVFRIILSSTSTTSQAGGNDMEQQSSNEDTVVIGNPRMLHQQAPILGEDEHMLDSDDETEAKESKYKPISPHRQLSNCSLSDNMSHRPDKRNLLQVHNGDDESSVSSAPSTISLAVTYRIEYIGDLKTTTKTIATSAGVHSETTQIEQLDDESIDNFDEESASASLSIQTPESID